MSVEGAEKRLLVRVPRGGSEVRAQLLRGASRRVAGRVALNTPPPFLQRVGIAGSYSGLNNYRLAPSESSLCYVAGWG